MKKILFIVFLTFVGFIFSCKNTNSSESTQQTESNSSEGESTENTTNPSTQEKAPTILYAWVDKLRVREQPTTKSEIVVEVKEGTSFTYLNEKTDYKERINLRGTLFNEPWLKIQTDDGKEGWVFGGAVKFYEPVVDTNPSPYDEYFELKKDGKNEKAKIAFDKAYKKQVIKNETKVNIKEDEISLTLLTGKNIELKKPVETEEQYSYHFWEYLEKIGFFLVHQSYDDYGGSFLLINDKSGKSTPINGYPKVSPDNKYLITFNADLEGAESGIATNGIQVFGFPNGRFKKLFEKEFEDMEPHTPKWIDNKTIEITLMPASYDKETKPRNIKVVIDKKGDWEIKD